MYSYVKFRVQTPVLEHTFVTLMFQLQINYKWVFNSLPLVTLYVDIVTALVKLIWIVTYYFFRGTRSCPDQGCAKFLTWLTEHFHKKSSDFFFEVLYYQDV